MPITRLYTTGLLPTCPLPYCILLVGYQQAHYQTVYYCSATNRPINQTENYCSATVYQTVYFCSATDMPITRLYSTVLLPTCPLPDCILLVCYQQAHHQTVYYCSATNRPITRLYTTVCYHQAHYQTVSTVRLPTVQFPDCIVLFCYNMPITRLYTTVLLQTGPLPD